MSRLFLLVISMLSTGTFFGSSVTVSGSTFSPSLISFKHKDMIKKKKNHINKGVGKRK